MNLLNSPFGLRVGPQIQNPEELFKTKGKFLIQLNINDLDR